MEGVGRGDPRAVRDVDRIGLEGRRAVVAGVVDGGVEERVREPWPRDLRPTTKHTIDHTALSSSGARALENASRS